MTGSSDSAWAARTPSDVCGRAFLASFVPVGPAKNPPVPCVYRFAPFASTGAACGLGREKFGATLPPSSSPASVRPDILWLSLWVAGGGKLARSRLAPRPLFPPGGVGDMTRCTASTLLLLGAPTGKAGTGGGGGDGPVAPLRPGLPFGLGDRNVRSVIDALLALRCIAARPPGPA